MRIRRSADALELVDIHPLFAELLSELPRAASRHESARARLYPDPFGGEGAEGEIADWQEHVQPELERHFASSRERVAADLAAGRRAGVPRLVIAQGHIQDWLNALNQARLVIVEENLFTERDLSGAEAPDLSTRRGLSLLKVHFYAHLQELLLLEAGG